MAHELAKQYAPIDVESHWYSQWLQKNIFAFPDTTNDDVYSILMPPPNVTGMLTMGHVLNHTIQDLYIRYNRKKGKVAAWFPGLDHAGIATQSKVEGMLRKEEGITRYDLGREEFVKRVYQWKDKYGNIILDQLHSLGNSCDWQRTLFTMDEGASNAVQDAFIQLFDDGLIYRGKRIINWSPTMQSALSDEEVLMREVEDVMFTLRYYFHDSDSYISVATVRPETVFGDVAVAVNPNDERYAGVIGKSVRVPLSDRYVPIIADDYVEKDFGTGCLKITPAHDKNDYEVGMRHNLAVIMTIDAHAKLTEETGSYCGLDRFEARKIMVADMISQGLVEKQEPYTHKVGFSERGGEVVEPFYSDQWFVKMSPLAKPALEVVKNGEIKFYPEHWTKTYEHWMNNINDWCISRQLWWGHRIPVYYTTDGQFTAAASIEQAREKLGVDTQTILKRDEDSLDTWFSAWLWMLTTMNWRSDSATTETALLQTYLPTNLLVTGPDIIFFWVARMIMASLYFKKTIPFKDVYFTSIIRDGDGRKMSKSLGNSPDPLELFKKYGADAVRYTTLYLAPLGQDIKINVVESENGISDAPQMEFGRNFANKIWNAARFLQLKAAEAGIEQSYETIPSLESLTASDKWILSRYHSTIQNVNESLANYRITEYTRFLYDFIWKDFCDWYVEILKVQFAQSQSSGYRESLMKFALEIFDGAMGLLHPIMPFITEEIWHTMASRSESEFLAQLPLPELNTAYVNLESERLFALVQAVIEEARTMKLQAGIKASQKLPVILSCNSSDVDLLMSFVPVIATLSRNELPVLTTDDSVPDGALSSRVQNVTIHLIAADKIDVTKERERLTKEYDRLQNLLRSALNKLNNEKFVANAKEEVVAIERNKVATAQEGIDTITIALSTLQ